MVNKKRKNVKIYVDKRRGRYIIVDKKRVYIDKLQNKSKLSTTDLLKYIFEKLYQSNPSTSSHMNSYLPKLRKTVKKESVIKESGIKESGIKHLAPKLRKQRYGNISSKPISYQNTSQALLHERAQALTQTKLDELKVIEKKIQKDLTKLQVSEKPEKNVTVHKKIAKGRIKEEIKKLIKNDYNKLDLRHLLRDNNVLSMAQSQKKTDDELIKYASAHNLINFDNYEQIAIEHLNNEASESEPFSNEPYVRPLTKAESIAKANEAKKAKKAEKNLGHIVAPPTSKKKTKITSYESEDESTDHKGININIKPIDTFPKILGEKNKKGTNNPNESDESDNEVRDQVEHYENLLENLQLEKDQESNSKNKLKIQEQINTTKNILDKYSFYTGEGMRRKMDSGGLSNVEIDKMMKKYPEYLGTISHDQIHTLPIKPLSRGCFIINTDPSTKSGRHWQAVYFDARLGGEKEIDFYDSYGDAPDGTILRGLKWLAEKLNNNGYLKFKVNRVVKQGDTNNCGFFCMQFLIDRLNGKHFTNASGFDDHLKGEKDIEKFKLQMGYGQFSYLSSFGKYQPHIHGFNEEDVQPQPFIGPKQKGEGQDKQSKESFLEGQDKLSKESFL